MYLIDNFEKKEEYSFSCTRPQRVCKRKRRDFAWLVKDDNSARIQRQKRPRQNNDSDYEPSSDVEDVMEDSLDEKHEFLPDSRPRKYRALDQGCWKPEKLMKVEDRDMNSCEFCGLSNSLTVRGKTYLVRSKTMSHLRICNACKSYEYRNGKLVKPDDIQRKNCSNPSKRARNNRHGRKKRFHRNNRKRRKNMQALYDSEVEEEEEADESEEEFYTDDEEMEKLEICLQPIIHIYPEKIQNVPEIKKSVATNSLGNTISLFSKYSAKSAAALEVKMEPKKKKNAFKKQTKKKQTKTSKPTRKRGLISDVWWKKIEAKSMKNEKAQKQQEKKRQKQRPHRQQKQKQQHVQQEQKLNLKFKLKMKRSVLLGVDLNVMLDMQKPLGMPPFPLNWNS